MANTRLITALAAAGLIAAAVPAGVAWAGGPAGSGDAPDISVAVGTGTFVGELDGFVGTGDSNDEAAASVLAQCNAAGGVDCTVDEVTNDNLCIVSVADDASDVVAGGAGPTVQAAVADAFARAAGNNTPLAPNSPVVVSSCP